MWHMTRDTWHVTCDTWHVWGVNILSKFQLPSSYRLWFMILWSSGGKGWLDQSINQSVNDEAVYRTAPATPGLLIKWNIIHFSMYLLFMIVYFLHLKKKPRIRETKHLLTDADSSTNAIGGWTENTPKPDFFENKKNHSKHKNSKTPRDMPICQYAIRPLTRGL